MLVPLDAEAVEALPLGCRGHVVLSCWRRVVENSLFHTGAPRRGVGKGSVGRGRSCADMKGGLWSQMPSRLFWQAENQHVAVYPWCDK